MITMHTVLKLKRKDKNPYEEGSTSWNVYIDASICESNGIVKIEDMMRYNDLPESYYQTYCGPLLEDGILEVA